MTATAPAHVPPAGPSSGIGPLRIGAYYVPMPSEAIMTWAFIVTVIARGDLGDFNRHPSCLEAYYAWRDPVKEIFGSMEQYIRLVRLGWPEPVQEETDGRAPGMEFFRADWKEDFAMCIANDWPYGIPSPECGHYVVWSRAPIIGPKLFEDAATPFKEEERISIYDAVALDGVRGLTGEDRSDPQTRVLGMNTITLLQQKDDVGTGEDSGGKATEQVYELAEKAHAWAGREVRKYVIARWPESCFETAWFCNPVRLRTVPGLSHFHVIVRRKGV